MRHTICRARGWTLGLARRHNASPTLVGASRIQATRGAITAFASSLTPRNVFEAYERWYSNPTKTSPRWVVDTPPTWNGPPCSSRAPSSREVAHARAVPRCQDDRVDRLGGPVAPDHPVFVERGEHRTLIHASLSEGLPEADAVGDHRTVGDRAQPGRRQGVEAGLAEPVVDVVATDALGDEPDGMACGDRGGRDRREFVRDLRGGVTRTHDDDALAIVRRRIPVVGDVDDVAGEGFLSREGLAGTGSRTIRSRQRCLMQGVPVRPR